MKNLIFCANLKEKVSKYINNLQRGNTSRVILIYHTTIQYNLLQAITKHYNLIQADTNIFKKFSTYDTYGIPLFCRNAIIITERAIKTLFQIKNLKGGFDNEVSNQIY